MKKFIIQLILFAFVLFLIGEVVIRTFKLTSDIPQRFIEQHSGLQLYKPGQSGYYKKSTTKWEVNEYGWLGVDNTEKKPLFSIIGDSYIENIMNPISCNQGFILQSYFKNYSFFEAGRSGVTFIEALEISKYLDSLIQPTFHLIYLGDGDFNESIAQINRFTDRVQVDLDKKLILKSKLKSPFAKRILYSSKLLYYMYLRFPLFVSKQNKGETINESTLNIPTSDYVKISELLKFCSTKYDLNRIVLVFHPKIDSEIVIIAKSLGFSTFNLQENNRTWALGKVDGHWSCYGHHEAAKQLISLIDSLVIKYERTTKNIVHLADSSKNGDDNNK